jgi:hypothetical protein
MRAGTASVLLGATALVVFFLPYGAFLAFPPGIGAIATGATALGRGETRGVAGVVAGGLIGVGTLTLFALMAVSTLVS